MKDPSRVRIRHVVPRFDKNAAPFGYGCGTYSPMQFSAESWGCPLVAARPYPSREERRGQNRTRVRGAGAWPYRTATYLL